MNRVGLEAGCAKLMSYFYTYVGCTRFFLLLRASLERSNNIARGKDSFTIDVRFIDTDALHLKRDIHGSVMRARGEASEVFKTVSFSDGFVVVDPEWMRGLHVGTYVFDLLVTWAKENYGDYRVCPIKLFIHQGRENDERDHRNRFYERFGFRFVFDDAEKRSGISEPELSINELSNVDSWKKNISLLDEADYLRDLAHRFRLCECEKASTLANANYVASALSNISALVEKQCNRRVMIFAAVAFVAGLWVCSAYPVVGKIFGY